VGVVKRGPWPAAVAALVVASTALRAWAGSEVPVPWIAPDEMVYGFLGSSLWHSGSLEVLGGPTPYYSLLFPALVGAPLGIGSLGFGYGAAKVALALTMSLTAVPVYLWGRSLVSRGWALVAAVLALAVPGLAYSGLLMTETLFYPLLTLAAWAGWRALAEPTPRAQALFVLAAVAAGATRMQALVLLPAFATAVGVEAAFERSWRPVRRLWPALAALVSIAAGWFAYRVVIGEALLGGYAGVTETSYSAGETAKYVVYHAASLLILTGVFPLCAVAVMLVQGLLRGEPSREVRAYLAIASSLGLWVVLQVGVFASQHVERLAERDLLALAPTLFLGLCLWLDRGTPRRYAVAAGVGVAAAAVLVALPVERLVTDEAAPDAFTLVPLLQLVHHTSGETLRLVYYLVAAAAVVAFVLLPRRALFAVPAVLIAAGVAASVDVSRYVADRAEAAQVAYLGPDRRWIDHAADGPTAYVYAGERDWTGVWHTLFWNRRVERVYDLQDEVPGALPQTEVAADPDGRIGPADVAYAVAPTPLTLSGEPVAQILHPGLLTTLRLWRLRPPLRLVSRTVGVLPTGDVSGTATVTGYGCRNGGTFVVTLLIKTVPVQIGLRVNGADLEPLGFQTAPGDGAWRGRIPAPPRADGICTLEIAPNALIGSTVLLFEPR
jgi:hypothetical protein